MKDKEKVTESPKPEKASSKVSEPIQHERPRKGGSYVVGKDGLKRQQFTKGSHIRKSGDKS
ncbi:MAG: hypothetical protein OQJ95_10080 [Kangiella sp.]|nr:hypothetical protein [Kangiella sp.]MCW9029669.1 hypothetical protein [Kangiella sp.]